MAPQAAEVGAVSFRIRQRGALEFEFAEPQHIAPAAAAAAAAPRQLQWQCYSRVVGTQSSQIWAVKCRAVPGGL